MTAALYRQKTVPGWLCAMVRMTHLLRSSFGRRFHVEARAYRWGAGRMSSPAFTRRYIACVSFLDVGWAHWRSLSAWSNISSSAALRVVDRPMLPPFACVRAFGCTRVRQRYGAWGNNVPMQSSSGLAGFQLHRFTAMVPLPCCEGACAALGERQLYRCERAQGLVRAPIRLRIQDAQAANLSKVSLRGSVREIIGKLVTATEPVAVGAWRLCRTGMIACPFSIGAQDAPGAP